MIIKNHIKRKFLIFVLIFTLAFTMGGLGSVQAIDLTGQNISGVTDIQNLGQLPELTAKSAVLMDAETGQILYDKDCHQQRYPASTTKIMTALLTIENLNDEDIITIDKEAEEMSGSQIYLVEGEQVKMKDLLYGMMLASANDAAAALGIAVGGTVTDFVTMMNDRAREAGALNTHFNNTNGLPDEEHTTTAYDLAMITKSAFQHQEFKDVVSTVSYTIPATNMTAERKVKNGNAMLYDEAEKYEMDGKVVSAKYKGTTGVKTGYTDSAGSCLVASVKRGNQELIGVVLGCETEQHFVDMIKLMDYGFSNYKKVKLISAEDYQYEVKVKKSEVKNINAGVDGDVIITLPKGADPKNVTTNVDIKKKYEAPIEENQALGSLEVCYSDQLVCDCDIVARTAAAEKPVPGAPGLILLALKIAGIIIAVLLVLFIIFRIIGSSINRKRRKKREMENRRRRAKQMQRSGRRGDNYPYDRRPPAPQGRKPVQTRNGKPAQRPVQGGKRPQPPADRKTVVRRKDNRNPR